MNIEKFDYIILIIIIPITFLLFITYRKRISEISSYIKKNYRLSNSQANKDFSSTVKNKSLISFFLFCCSIIFLIGSLMQFHWGEIEIEMDLNPPEFVIALDVSLSMLAQDVSPSRIDKAKELITKFLTEFTNNDIGCVTFNQKCYVETPITNEIEIISSHFLDIIDANYIQNLNAKGTNIASALDVSYSLFSPIPSKNKVLILFSDGETHDLKYDNSLERLCKNGIKIITIGIGKQNYSYIPVIKNNNNNYKRDNNNSLVQTRLNRQTLKELSNYCNGLYLEYDNSSWVLEIKDFISQLFVSTPDKISIYQNQYQIFLILSILMLIGLILKSLK